MSFLSRLCVAGFTFCLLAAGCQSNPSTPTNAAATDISGLVDGHPAWIMQGNIYEVNVRQYTPEGTFNAFAKHLDRLKDMGVQTLWFMPIQPISKVDRKGELGSYYAVSDYTAINPEYGTMEDWKQLVQAAHDKGFKVIIDWVPNHTGGDHAWLQNHPDFFVRDSAGRVMAQFDWTDTRKLDYHNSALVDSMINTMKFWISETGIDGYRCDQAALVGEGLLWNKCIPELKKMKNILMLAESEDPWVHTEGFDMSYPWRMFHTTVDIAAGKKPASAIDEVIRFVDSSFPANALQLYFTSNHDENSWNGADYHTMPGASHAPFAVLTQTMARGVPLVYSGQEEPYLDSISFFYKDTIGFGRYERAHFYKTLLNLRKNHPALAANASFRKVNAGDDQRVYAYLRQAGSDKVLVVLNLSKDAVKINITDADLKGEAENLFNGGKEVPTVAGWGMEPWGYAVFTY